MRLDMTKLGFEAGVVDKFERAICDLRNGIGDWTNRVGQTTRCTLDCAPEYTETNIMTAEDPVESSLPESTRFR